MARIDSFFKLMAEQKASDLHLSTGNPPMLRINGDLVRVDYPPLVNDELKAMVYEIAPEAKIKVFEETSDVDFGYEVPGVARYRANFFQQKYGISAVFRLIPSKVLTVEDLGLPPVLKKFPLLKKGLVLVTGPTGSGKSTTLAAMMDYANLQSPWKIRSSLCIAVRIASCNIARSGFTLALSRPHFAARCVKIRTSCSSVKCAIWRRSNWL